jgi:hypothetical protein
VVPDQVDVAFDDQRAVASAGLLLPATLAERLGIERVTPTSSSTWASGLGRPSPAASC